MSLIFHRFPSTETAEAFVAEVERQFSRGGGVYTSQEEADAVDFFPFKLDPPIALVDRDESLTLEGEIEASVKAFGGEFAGT